MWTRCAQPLPWSRRGYPSSAMESSMHRSLLVWGLFVIAAAAVAPGQTDFQPDSVIEELGAGVYVLRDAAGSVALPVHGSVAFIVGDRDVVVVDSSRTASAARLALQSLGEITDKPVRALINTHWHEDHVLGNEVFLEAYPGISIIAHSSTRNEIAHEAADEFGPSVARFEQSLARVLETLERGTTVGGEPLTREARGNLIATRDMFNYVLPQDRIAAFVVPNVVFDRELSLFQDEREIRVLHLGRGNTAGDAVVFLPAEGVLIAGDLVVAPVPYGSGSFPSEWIEVMERLDALEFTTLVPGHGPTMHDRDYLHRVRDLLVELVAEAHRARSDGLGPQAALDSELVQGVIEGFVGDDPSLRRSMMNFFVRPVVGRAYDEPLDR